ncbi:MAG TPA: hypothetical protein VFD58_35810 [Blastocatellia bacterium]|nr:hypothetical protein [Blastocatellia bacterium]
MLRFILSKFSQKPTDSTKKVKLPDREEPLISPNADEICGHLKPVLDYLLSGGAAIERAERDPASGWLAVTLNDFFHRDQIYDLFEVPRFIKWDYADPHYGQGNSLICAVCGNSLESRFDLSDPVKTLGP